MPLNSLPLVLMKYTSRKKLGSYPTFGVVLSITLALFVTGLFGLLIIYSIQLERVVRDNVKMQVYLNTNLAETQRLQVENKIISMNFVNKTGDTKGIEFISKEEAAKKFIQETGEDFTRFMGDNPLKDAYLVSIDPSFHTAAAIEKIKKDLEKVNGVFQVSYVEDLIESINQNIRKISLILLGIASLLLLTVILLINNTMRIALFSQRFLIRSMQLVGAKQWFIQRPFLLRAAALGTTGALLALAFLYSAVQYAQREIEDLVLLHNQQQFMYLAGSMLLTGLLIAVFSSYLSIRKYLRLSLDELF
jgi:cell division transport system permease protein